VTQIIRAAALFRRNFELYIVLVNTRVPEYRATTEGTINAEGNQDSDNCFSSSWDGYGIFAYLCDGRNHITSGDGECGHCEEDRPTLCKMSFCAACVEYLWEEIQRRPEEIGKM
jgi:hypothetical protein